MSKTKSPSPQTNLRVTPEIAARVLYDNWSGLASLPSPARELASQGHFFSALRLLFEPDADLTKPPESMPAPETQKPVLYVSEKQLAQCIGTYLPTRAEAEGNFQLALYRHPPTPQSREGSAK
jgi:hypothetical protein